MVKVKKDLTGQVFGRLKVLERASDYVDPHGNPYPCWKCECSCNEHRVIVVRGADLKSGHTKSCGCIAKETTALIGKSTVKLNVYSEMITDEYGEYYIGFTSNTNREFYVDADDLEKIRHITWGEYYYSGMSYLKGWDPESKRMEYMHVFMGYRGYDHADRNELNNRKYNLRPANNSDNACNRNLSNNKSTGFVGVRKRKNGTYRAILTKNKKKLLDKTFATFEDAKIARLKAEAEWHKEFSLHRDLFDEYKIESSDNL